MMTTPHASDDPVEPSRDVEAALRESEERFRALVHYSSDMISVVDTGGVIRYTNPAAERQLGYRSAVVVGTRAEDWLHPDDVERMRAALAQRVAQPDRPPERVVFRLRHRDGSWRWVEAVTTGMMAEAGVEALIISSRDVTERVEAEAETRRLNAELERRVAERTADVEEARAQAERVGQRFAFLADASAALVSALDLDVTLQNIARAAVPALADGCTVGLIERVDAVRQVAVAHLDPTKADALRQLQRDYPFQVAGPAPMREALRRGELVYRQGITAPQLAAIARDDGHLRLLRTIAPTSLLSMPLTARGQLLGAITFFVTEPGREAHALDVALAQELARRAALAVDNAWLYRQARQALDEAQAALRVRDEFLSIASHELRTPLTALSGQLQLADRWLQRGSTERVPPVVQQAGRQVDRLAKLIDTLLDASRIADGRFALEREPLALRPLLGRVVELARAASDPPRRIELVSPDVSPVVLGDADRLELVFVNLLENARKYSSADRPIRVWLTTDDELVTVAVRDEGVGIPAEEQASIFDRFHRASNIDVGISGMGLGLYLSRETVQAHGGQLTVASAPNVGSTFTVTLPRLRELGEDVAG